MTTSPNALAFGWDGRDKPGHDVEGASISGRRLSIESGGENYLVPVDAELALDRDIADETVALDRVFVRDPRRQTTESRHSRRLSEKSLVARDRSKAIERGCAPVEPLDADTLVAFAAASGVPALDAEGADTPFAAAPANRLFAPGVDVEFALRAVHDDVLAATGGRQAPFTSGLLGGSPLQKTSVREPTAIMESVVGSTGSRQRRMSV